MRVSVAERARLSVLLGRRAFRSLLGSINAHPLVRWRFASTKTDRLVIAPQDRHVDVVVEAGLTTDEQLDRPAAGHPPRHRE